MTKALRYLLSVTLTMASSYQMSEAGWLDKCAIAVNDLVGDTGLFENPYILRRSLQERTIFERINGRIGENGIFVNPRELRDRIERDEKMGGNAPVVYSSFDGYRSYDESLILSNDTRHYVTYGPDEDALANQNQKSPRAYGNELVLGDRRAYYAARDFLAENTALLIPHVRFTADGWLRLLGSNQRFLIYRNGNSNRRYHGELVAGRIQKIKSKKIIVDTGIESLKVRLSDILAMTVSSTDEGFFLKMIETKTAIQVKKKAPDKFLSAVLLQISKDTDPRMFLVKSGNSFHWVFGQIAEFDSDKIVVKDGSKVMGTFTLKDLVAYTDPMTVDTYWSLMFQP